MQEREKVRELEVQERAKQREIEERLKLKEIEDREKQRNFELQKLQLQNENKIVCQTSNEGNTTVPESNIKTIDFRNLMQKFDVKESEISSFLILFERQAKRVGLEEGDYVFHLLGLLPLEITQLIARESEEEASNYAFVKKLLLKRFKLSPEKFRQKFVSHVKDSKSTWSDYVFEIRNFFNEWLSGLKVNDLDSLKELIITDQLKKRVPGLMREHFIDSWPNYVNASELATKLDEYDSVRSGLKINSEKSTKSVGQYDDYKNYSRVSNFPNSNRYDNKFENRNAMSHKSFEKESPSKYDSNKSFNSKICNVKREPKCFSCNNFGHISKDCPYPCNLCGLKGHSRKNCINKNKKEVNLSASDPEYFACADKYFEECYN